MILAQDILYLWKLKLMKNPKTRVFLFLILFCSSVSYSQKITTDIYSGVNFSDIHGQDFGGKWQSKPGPVQGFYLGWLFNSSIGIQTGMNFSTVYYEHKTTYYPITYLTPSIYDYDVFPVYYNQAVDKMDFSFLRVPLLLTLSIPSIIQFNMKAGLIFSFVQDHSLSNYYYYYYSSQPVNTKKNDFGYMFSSGISYPLSDKFNATFNVSYLTGRKHFLENANLRHGSSEYTLGIDYEFLKKNKTAINPKFTSDSASKKVTVTYWGGVDISWNGLDADRGKYSSGTGPSLGFSVNFPLGSGFSFISGVSFERKGYSMKDSSTLFYKYMNNSTPMYYVDTKVQTDYAVIPFLISFPIGKSQMVFFNTGPWLGLKLNARNVGVAYNEIHSESSYTVNKTVIYDDLERYIKDNDIGWIFSTRVSLPLFNRYKVDLALQYSTGFNNVYNKTVVAEEQSSTVADYVIRNRTISFIVGFTIPASKH
jgi:hypothetical protein